MSRREIAFIRNVGVKHLCSSQESGQVRSCFVEDQLKRNHSIDIVGVRFVGFYVVRFLFGPAGDEAGVVG